MELLTVTTLCLGERIAKGNFFTGSYSDFLSSSLDLVVVDQ